MNLDNIIAGIMFLNAFISFCYFLKEITGDRDKIIINFNLFMISISVIFGFLMIK